MPIFIASYLICACSGGRAWAAWGARRGEAGGEFSVIFLQDFLAAVKNRISSEQLILLIAKSEQLKRPKSPSALLTDSNIFPRLRVYKSSPVYGYGKCWLVQKYHYIMARSYLRRQIGASEITSGEKVWQSCVSIERNLSQIARFLAYTRAIGRKIAEV